MMRDSDNLKYIFWDNDGVLVDTERLYFKATQLIFEREGFSLTKELFIDNFLKQSRGAWFLFQEKGYSEEDISKFREERNKIYNTLLRKENLLIPGINETLKNCAEKFKMAIVTSSRKDHFETIHNSTGILKYFDFFLTREDYTNSKPDPEPYVTALRRSGVLSSEVIVIEDSERGLKSALAAGMRCVIIPNNLTSNSNFSGAEKILNSHNELYDYLLWNNIDRKKC